MTVDDSNEMRLSVWLASYDDWLARGRPGPFTSNDLPEELRAEACEAASVLEMIETLWPRAGQEVRRLSTTAPDQPREALAGEPAPADDVGPPVSGERLSDGAPADPP
ncbi:MAG: hypothetical protein KY476_11250 [Planctomycetes bacterium]|nr:hypothetical protein [Planctomycetota bacterium]